VLFALVACRRDPAPPPTLEIAAPAVVPAGAESITCRVGPKQAMVALDDAGLHLRFVTARGNTISMFGQSIVAGDPADSTLADAVARFADERAGAEWIDVIAKVASPDGQSANVKVSLHIDRMMTKRLDAARSAALLFPGEAASPSANKIAWVHSTTAAPYVLGEGRWRDIDVVVFDSEDSVNLHACGTTPGDFGDITVLRGQTRNHVEVYDRRAGRRVDQTTIDSPDSCGQDARFSNEPAVRAWIVSKLAK
jgi:hypothetical protein